MLKRSLTALLLLQISSLWLVKQTIAQSSSSTASTPALICSAGYYMTNYGCAWCPAGAYCPGYTYNPIPCPLGTSSNWNSGLSECTVCSSGMYASVPGSEYCQSCPPGYSCSDPASGPVPCPVGTSTNGMQNADQCWPCMDGMIANTTGSVYCSNCPEGYYCPNASVAIACPKGMASRLSYNNYNR